jgi:hypothetical protein
MVGRVDPADRAIHWFRSERLRSGGDGSFAIHGLGRGEYVIRTGDRDIADDAEWKGTAFVSGNRLVDTRAGSISGLEVRLHAAARLVLHETASADGMRFRVVDANGLETAAGRLDGTAPCPILLPPGSYRVSRLDAGGALLSERPVTVEAEAVEIDLAR